MRPTPEKSDYQPSASCDLETAIEEVWADFPEGDFWPASTGVLPAGRSDPDGSSSCNLRNYRHRE